jgi:hypothetical protein
MHMRGNGPWGFTLAPHLCKAFPKESIGKFGATYRSQLPHKDFQFGFGMIIKFWPITPTHSTLVFTCYKYCWVNYGDTRGGGGVLLQQDKYILGNYGIRDAKKYLWGWNKKLVTWGVKG